MKLYKLDDETGVFVDDRNNNYFIDNAAGDMWMRTYDGAVAQVLVSGRVAGCWTEDRLEAVQHELDRLSQGRNWTDLEDAPDELAAAASRILGRPALDPAVRGNLNRIKEFLEHELRPYIGRYDVGDQLMQTIKLAIEQRLPQSTNIADNLKFRTEGTIVSPADFYTALILALMQLGVRDLPLPTQVRDEHPFTFEHRVGTFRWDPLDRDMFFVPRKLLETIHCTFMVTSDGEVRVPVWHTSAERTIVAPDPGEEEA